jgi:hypothetical protein
MNGTGEPVAAESPVKPAPVTTAAAAPPSPPTSPSSVPRSNGVNGHKNHDQAADSITASAPAPAPAPAVDDEPILDDEQPPPPPPAGVNAAATEEPLAMREHEGHKEELDELGGHGDPATAAADPNLDRSAEEEPVVVGAGEPTTTTSAPMELDVPAAPPMTADIDQPVAASESAEPSAQPPSTFFEPSKAQLDVATQQEAAAITEATPTPATELEPSPSVAPPNVLQQPTPSPQPSQTAELTPAPAEALPPQPSTSSSAPPAVSADTQEGTMMVEDGPAGAAVKREADAGDHDEPPSKRQRQDVRSIFFSMVMRGATLS